MELYKTKEELEDRYLYKKFAIMEKNKLFELDKYGRAVKEITDGAEYIEETDKIYSKVADVLNIVSVYNKENKVGTELSFYATDGDLIEQIYKAISKK